MAAAFALFFKLIPLYVTVGLGWIAGRYLEASGRHIAGIMLYIVTPSVVVSGVMTAPLSPEVILLPFLVFGISSVLRSEEHTSELQSRPHLVCRLLLEKKK